MHTSAAVLELDFTEPSITAAKVVADTIAGQGSLQRDTLLWVMEQAYGGSSADGRWSLRDAYDMLELAEVMYLAKADLPSTPGDCLAALTALVAGLPTHTARSQEQIELQQFSTPAPIAYLAALAGRIATTDLVLEPSAGTGLLAAFAHRAGARLVLNEIDPARAEMLAAAFPGVAVTRHDGELIHDLLEPTIRPTAVLINPPFSRSIGRHAGIAALELIARDLKMQGLYVSRALSFVGVEYDILEHKLTADQIEVYDAYADAWAIIHSNLRAALDATRVTDSFSNDTYNSGAKAAALSIFESTKQRFFCQLLIGMKLPSLVPAIRADLARGESVVIQLISTSEAMLNRALAALTVEERANLDIELSPREFLMSYLTAAFPVRQMKTFVDETGKTRSEPMSDEDGRPVFAREALEMRDNLLEQLCALPVVGSALDHIIGHFGTDAVAEVTGRSRRVIMDVAGRQRVESRSPRTNLAETDAFMRGQKKILIFSDAGGTGRSYHASLTCENQSRRNHYLLEPGWRADAAIQGLGRTHRTHQATAPLFRPVSTDCRGERRFISTIARRLDSLGALTRGQRQTGGQGLFDPRDNLESDYAKESLEQWFRLLANGKLRSTTLDEFQKLTGLELEGEGGGLKEEMPPIQRWLNRILALRIAMQNAIFDEYLGLIEARIEAAKEAGTLDLGVESINAERITILDRTVIRRDQTSGAETEILRLETEERYKPLALDRALRTLGDDARPIVNRKSGKAAIRCSTYSLTDDDGEIVRRYELVRPTRTERMRQDLLLETMWEDASEAEFSALWQAEVEEMSGKTRTNTLYLVTGLLLPVWDRLPDDHVQVWRLNTDDGQSFLGRIVPAPLVTKLADAFGIAATITVSGAETAKHVMGTAEITALGAYRLKRSLVAGQQRLELLDWPHTRLAELKAAGCFTEIIQHKTRMFIPVATAATVIDRITA
ncbi:NTP hydrolase family protein [Sphingomonas sp. PP-CE-1A-559]|uniref:strawberry notch C-terminal domain-containing protein n=1 Tax=Sphingomonas sp. PP-CE-1A-559 TaxID=2135657 RepID=UPI001054F9A8|nr:strawberry notch C-terminal domain-containing protein [Sphingomonas sp. PP-CE-1A-559]TCP87109.1 NTP hydrolase family protein [Sphingomonas sp. PP-CE-1A-559]